MKKKRIECMIAAVLAILMMSCGDRQAVQDANLEKSSTLESEWKAEKSKKLKPNLDNGCIRQNGLQMKFSYTVFGDEPADGRSLWISLHGGGGAPTEVNDSQWENQKRLYQPAEGIYLCPRAPWDAWDMWFQQPIDAMFEELITTMVVLKNVNPNKVYLLGYSAGGDGVWRLAPRLADHWAAASMMAGHPGDVSLLNVRNLPFLLWVGENDSAYDRNKEVAKRGVELDSLQQTDPQGYLHEWHVVEGKPHWMDLVDAAALPWMARHVRNPYPSRIVWRQEEVLRPWFYWLEAPAYEQERGKTVIVEVNDNVINVERCDYSGLTFLLNEHIVNLDNPITVKSADRVLFQGRVQRDEAVRRRTLYDRNDPSFIFDAELTVSMSEQ